MKKRRPIRTLLAELVPEALASVSWPKSMRWEESGTRWVRPIRSILCLLDDEVVPFRFGTVESGRTTFGHRFLKPQPITVEHANIYREPSYVEMLQKAKVMLDPDQRMEKIEKDADERAQRKGCRVEHVGGLLAENAGLVEWPVVLMGSIEEEFMSLPAEVLSSAMSTHQRYFSLIDEDDRLGAPLRDGRQHHDRRRQNRHRRRQRAGAARAPRRCALLLGAGSAQRDWKHTCQRWMV